MRLVCSPLGVIFPQHEFFWLMYAKCEKNFSIPYFLCTFALDIIFFKEKSINAIDERIYAGVATLRTTL